MWWHPPTLYFPHSDSLVDWTTSTPLLHRIQNSLTLSRFFRVRYGSSNKTWVYYKGFPFWKSSISLFVGSDFDLIFWRTQPIVTSASSSSVWQLQLWTTSLWLVAWHHGWYNKIKSEYLTKAYLRKDLSLSRRDTKYRKFNVVLLLVSGFNLTVREDIKSIPRVLIFHFCIHLYSF